MTHGAIETQADPISALRSRTSAKWRLFPDDVLPLFVAEMDYPLAPAIISTLQHRIAASDSGYVAGPAEVGVAFAGFAERRWSWRVDPSAVRTATDVSVTIVEVLRRVLTPGDAVVISSPVYAPFRDLVAEAGGVVVDVPLRPSSSNAAGWELDVEGIDAAFAGGARAALISNPHNPLGLVHSAESLAGLAEAAAAHGATVVSDEIHGPLVHVGVTFTPFLAVSDAAREWGITVTSASKGFNLAGFKCALMVAASPRGLAVLDGMWPEVGYRTSILGLHATIAALNDSDEWLDATVAAIETSSSLLGSLLAAHLPDVTFRPPHASYLAWLDATALGWGDDPAERALELARVALNPGPEFGPSGAGFMRLNFACSPEVLTEAIERIAAGRCR